MRLLRQISLWALPVLGAALLISAAGTWPIQAEGVSMRLRATFTAPGKVILSIPPLGTISARAQSSLIGFQVTLEHLQLSQVSRSLAHTSESQALGGLLGAVKRAAPLFALWLLLLASLGGVLGRLLLGERTARSLSTAGATGFLTIGLLLALAYATFDAKAFSTPTYSGNLKAATWIRPLLSTSASELSSFEAQLAGLPAHLTLLFAHINTAPPMGVPPGSISVLIVSDMHDNVAGMKLVADMVKSFSPKFIIDAGDETYMGTALEARLLSYIKTLKVPYYVVAGNHDTLAVLRQLRSEPNVTILNGKEVTQDGVPMIGIQDAATGTTAPQMAPEPMAQRELLALQEDIKKAKRPPLIAVIHNFHLAPSLAGSAPIVITGHSHSQLIQHIKGSWIINPGTTGAGGVRGLFKARQTPYGLAMLHLQKTATGWRPYSVDTLLISEDTGKTTVSRQVLLPLKPATG